jgi:hypothetical protein
MADKAVASDQESHGQEKKANGQAHVEQHGAGS